MQKYNIKQFILYHENFVILLFLRYNKYAAENLRINTLIKK